MLTIKIKWVYTKQWCPDSQVSSSKRLSNKVSTHWQSLLHIFQTGGLLIKIEIAIGTANPMVNLQRVFKIDSYNYKWKLSMYLSPFKNRATVQVERGRRTSKVTNNATWTSEGQVIANFHWRFLTPNNVNGLDRFHVFCHQYSPCKEKTYFDVLSFHI